MGVDPWSRPVRSGWPGWVARQRQGRRPPLGRQQLKTPRTRPEGAALGGIPPSLPGEPHGRRHHAPAARERRPLRAPDPSLEPEDEALHLHRAQRHLHHRPAAVADATSTAPTSSSRRPSPTAARCCSSAPRSRPRRRSPSRPTRVGMPYVNQRWLGGMLTNFPTVHKRLQRAQGARGDRLRRRRRQRADQEGAARPAARAGQARADPRRHPRHGPGAGRGLDRRHQQGAPRRRRGPQARHPDHRDPRHQLRPGRGRLPDPGQRRRHPRRRACSPAWSPTPSPRA